MILNEIIKLHNQTNLYTIEKTGLFLYRKHSITKKYYKIQYILFDGQVMAMHGDSG